MSQDDTSSPSGKAKRERSTRYPGVPLAESVDLCKFVESHGLNGLSASDIALALGYKNIKTNTFSAKLSAARQFGLLVLKDEGYSLTTLAKSILHPIDPSDMGRLYRQALLEPPLYHDLAEQFLDKKLPDATILGNVLYNNYQIISSAKQAAAEAFLDSARFAGALSDDQVFHPGGVPASTAAAPATPSAPVASMGLPQNANLHTSGASSSSASERSHDVRIDLRLWDTDQGKSIRGPGSRGHHPRQFRPPDSDAPATTPDRGIPRRGRRARRRRTRRLTEFRSTTERRLPSPRWSVAPGFK